LGTFQDKEGITLIITEQQVKGTGPPYDSTRTSIFLTVLSSLSALGFLTVLTGRLAQAAISENAIPA
jgi:hypothetical protein